LASEKTNFENGKAGLCEGAFPLLHTGHESEGNKRPENDSKLFASDVLSSAGIQAFKDLIINKMESSLRRCGERRLVEHLFNEGLKKYVWDFFVCA